jgi:cell division protease FtsH
MMSTQELEAKLAVLMGGRASEELFFKEVSTGAADDLDKATEIARAIITRYGMSRKLGPVIYERETAPMLGAQGQIRTFNFSEDTAVVIDQEVKETLLRAEDMAKGLIQRHRDMIEEGVQLLLKQETLDEQELKTLWAKHVAQPPRKVAS